MSEDEKERQKAKQKEWSPLAPEGAPRRRIKESPKRRTQPMRPRRAQSWRLGVVMCRSEQIGDTRRTGRGCGGDTSPGERELQGKVQRAQWFQIRQRRSGTRWGKLPLALAVRSECRMCGGEGVA